MSSRLRAPGDSMVDVVSNRIARCVMLAGGPKASPLAEAVGGSVLDLPLSAGVTVLGRWLDVLGELVGDGKDCEPMDVRIVHGAQQVVPTRPNEVPSTVSVTIEAEEGEYRGAAGVARDATIGLGERDLVLVVEAARYAAGSLVPLVEAHIRRGADVTVAVNPDNSPAGVYLIEHRWLEGVQELGYADLKEQWLQRVIGEGGEVWPQLVEGTGFFPLRELGHFIDGVRALAGSNNEVIGSDGYGSEQTHGPGVGVIMAGAHVASSAAVIDAVVMDGAVVGERAVVARSVVCAGARVEADGEVVDAVLRG